MTGIGDEGGCREDLVRHRLLSLRCPICAETALLAAADGGLGTDGRIPGTDVLNDHSTKYFRKNRR